MRHFAFGAVPITSECDTTATAASADGFSFPRAVDYDDLKGTQKETGEAKALTDAGD
jgi:hypothetical protein